MEHIKIIATIYNRGLTPSFPHSRTIKIGSFKVRIVSPRAIPATWNRSRNDQQTSLYKFQGHSNPTNHDFYVSIDVKPPISSPSFDTDNRRKRCRKRREILPEPTRGDWLWLTMEINEMWHDCMCLCEILCHLTDTVTVSLKKTQSVGNHLLTPRKKIVCFW